jgi:hypothetical protein
VPDIRHRVGIAAPQDRVYAMLASKDGLAEFWTRREPVEFMHHCSIKWATYLIGLRSGLKGGAFAAFPDDTKVSSNWR